MKVVIIKYNAGNIESVANALRRLGVEPIITADEEEIRTADRVIFPGVGEAKNTMAYLKQNRLDVLIPSLKQPVLGICLGLQLMCSHSEEGDVDCLGIFNEQVKLFRPQANKGMKVPHMGWNTLTKVKEPLFDASFERAYVYFVHSYYATVGEHTIAEANYIEPFSAALHKANFYATQFHPEKSGDVGEQLLARFLNNSSI